MSDAPEREPANSHHAARPKRSFVPRVPSFDRLWPALITFLCVAVVIAVTLWRLHPSLLFSLSTPTGGDNGGHYALPEFLKSGLLTHGQLTGWDPEWYDGFPLYTYYFVLPDLLVALANCIHIPYELAFKSVTVLGSVLLPIVVWAMGRLFGMRRAFPGAIAALSLCLLFDYTFTIYGGNLFSTLAGEYAYSLGIALALLFIGLMAYGLRTGRHRVWTAIVLALCLLAHVVPGLYALVGGGLLVLMEMLPNSVRPHDGWRSISSDRVVSSTIDRGKALWWGVSTIGIGILLVGFWWVPFGLEQSYSNSMGYVNIHTFVAILLPKADWWALVIAGFAAVAAFVIRSRFGILMSLLAGLSALAVIFDPQATLYNVRFLPLWFLSIYLLVGWGVAAAVTGLADLWTWWNYRPQSPRAYLAPFTLSGSDQPDPTGTLNRSAGPSWPVAGVLGPLVALIVAVVVVVTPFVVSYNGMLDLGITPGANQVTNWSSYNYSGYQNMPAYPEYRAVIATMEKVGRQYGCGQAMWQYDPSLGRFGTTMALMLLPFWSNGCIGSMEGLLFESSSTTPYHFINQSELSVAPSEPQVGLDYSSLNVVAGIQHLQLLGVKYFMASSTQVEAEAAADPQLRQVASTGPWKSTAAGSTTSTTWDIYRILNSPEVVGLSNEPAVETGIKAGQSSWLQPSEDWYNNPSRWTVELAQSGPPSWPQVAIGDPNPPKVPVPKAKVTHVKETDNSVSFHVDRVGSPVLVKVSYFPNWQASGATGPYRVTPNLMVVVPTSNDVTLHYGATSANRLGELLTLGGIIWLFSPFWWPRLRRLGTRSSRGRLQAP